MAVDHPPRPSLPFSSSRGEGGRGARWRPGRRRCRPGRPAGGCTRRSRRGASSAASSGSRPRAPPPRPEAAAVGRWAVLAPSVPDRRRWWGAAAVAPQSEDKRRRGSSEQAKRRPWPMALLVRDPSTTIIRGAQSPARAAVREETAARSPPCQPHLPHPTLGGGLDSRRRQGPRRRCSSVCFCSAIAHAMEMELLLARLVALPLVQCRCTSGSACSWSASPARDSAFFHNLQYEKQKQIDGWFQSRWRYLMSATSPQPRAGRGGSLLVVLCQGADVLVSPTTVLLLYSKTSLAKTRCSSWMLRRVMP